MRYHSGRIKKTRGPFIWKKSETEQQDSRCPGSGPVCQAVSAYYRAVPRPFSVLPPPPPAPSTPTFSPLEFIQQQILSRIDRTHYGASGVGVWGGGTRLQKSLIRSLGCSEHYGRRWSIDRSEIANWKTLPIGALAEAHLGGMLLASRRLFHIWLLDPGR